MPSLKSIKKRIESVKNTEQITRAMYMVSAAKLRRAQENAESARPFTGSLESTIRNLVARLDNADHPLLKPRDEVKTAELVLFTSDRGLCGGFNANMIKAAEAFFRDNADTYEEIHLSAIGRRGGDYFKRRKRLARKVTTNLVREVSFEMAREIADELTERYVSGEVDAVFLLYPRFKSAMTQIPTVFKLLPFQFESEEEQEGSLIEYIYEPSVMELLDQLLPRQVRTQVFAAMLESVASEHGARMTAMDSATSNASEMIDNLTLQYNRARQAAITTELMEIISGAEAQKG
ncbi:MAG: ATP synthase F1 subunit gamma [bacterium]